jgi:hypothetical protein
MLLPRDTLSEDSWGKRQLINKKSWSESFSLSLCKSPQRRHYLKPQLLLQGKDLLIFLNRGEKPLDAILSYIITISTYHLIILGKYCRYSPSLRDAKFRNWQILDSMTLWNSIVKTVPTRLWGETRDERISNDPWILLDCHFSCRMI